MLPCWSTPEGYLAACYLALSGDEGVALRKRLGGVSVARCLHIAAEDCRTADGATGRNVMTSHETVSARLRARGIKASASAAKRARQVIERLGLAATVAEGRHLSAQERAEKRAEGKNQWVIASTRHLLVPRIWADALMRVREKPTSYHFLKSFFYRIQPVRPHQKRPKRNRKPTSRPSVPLPYRHLAAKLAQRLPWLNRLAHLGGVARILMEAGIQPELWTAHDLLTEIDHHRRKLGWNSPSTVSSPHGWLKFLLAGLPPATIEARVSLRERVEKEVEARRLSALKARPSLPPSPQEQETARKGLALVRAVLRAKRASPQ